MLARQLPSASSHPDADLHTLHQLLPGLGEPQPIRVGEDSPAVGRSLAILNLRGITGATVLAIIREKEGVLVPTGREILQPGDLLAVAGTSAAIDGAREVLGALAPG